MSTDKNRINAYVDDPSFEAFKKWCEQWECSASKGVELLIKQFLIESNVSSNLPSPVTHSNAQDNVLTPDWVREQIHEAIASYQSELLGKIEALQQQLDEQKNYTQGYRISEPTEKTSHENEAQDAFTTHQDELPQKDESEFIAAKSEDSLTGQQLAKLIGVDSTTIRRWKAGKIPQKPNEKQQQQIEQFHSWEYRENLKKWVRK